MALTILDGSTFCICDERGDIVSPTQGFFTADTRFLSRLCLTVNGERPLLLSSKKVEYFSAGFYLRNPLAGGLEQDVLAIGRNRFVGDGMQDTIVLENESMETIAFELAVELGSDFADIFMVKDYDFALGDPSRAGPFPEPVEPLYDEVNRQFLMHDAENGVRTQVVLSQARTRRRRHDHVPDRARAARAVGAAHRRRPLGRRRRSRAACGRAPLRRGALAGARLARRLEPERAAPHAPTGTTSTTRSATRSQPLASLRMRSDGGGNLPAAGMPWFMTVFGRDTIITCLQTLLFGPDLARGALHTLAELQATEELPGDRRRAGQDRPRGAAREGGGERLRAVVLDPRRDPALPRAALGGLALDGRRRARPRSLRPAAEACLEWIDRYGDRDGDGFVEYARRGGGGPENQSWKDSHDSQRFADGTLAAGPIAPVEVQGYVYDAKRRVAELAREVWRDRGLAERLDREAEELAARFDEAYWVEERGGYYALALDRDKRQVDSLTSNIGHLLWSGIVPPERADAVVDRMMGEPLWSGWGVRTMSVGRRRLQPALVPQRHRVAARQLPDRSRARPATGAGRRRSASRAGWSRPRGTSTTSSRRCSPGCRARRRRSRSPTRRPRGRRRGRPGPRCCCSRCCSGSARNAGARCSRPRPSSTCPPGPARSGSPGCRSSTGSGT